MVRRHLINRFRRAILSAKGISLKYPILSTLAFLVPALATAQTVSLNTLEREFRDGLTGATMEGLSSRDGQEGVSPDKYSIQKVEKTGGDGWTFHVKLAFSGQETIVPVQLDVKWAGDTPVITVADKGYPGMGTYTARVLVYKGHYAGTWYGKNGGGKVWGAIFKKPAAAIAAKASSPLTAGRWVGEIFYAGGLRVPFSLDLQQTGDVVTGAFYNGDQRAESKAGTWNGEGLNLEFPQYGQRLQAKLDNGALRGTYGERKIEASAYCACSYEGEAGPDISGKWKIEGTDQTLEVMRNGEDTWATLGGAIHTGRHDGLQFALSHFDGVRASLMEVQVRKDGALDVTWKQPGQGQVTHRAVLVR